MFSKILTIINKKNFYLIGLFFVFFIIGFLVSQNTNSEIKTIKRVQIILGTLVEIQVADKDEEKIELAINKAFDEIKRIDNLFTTYNQNSPVFKINFDTSSIINLHPEIYQLMILCDSISKISNYAFDISIERLINIWGFDSKNFRIPPRISIDSTLEFSGWRNVTILGDNKIMRKKNVRFNFGAVAKGYAVDKAIDVLKNYGLKDVLVNAGGDVKVLGKKWHIGIKHPRLNNEIIEVITLQNSSIATSGDYEQYFEVDGKRYHHIIDPKTGYPSKGISSVSIINKSNTIADALATAVFVLGLEDGLKLIESLVDTEAMIINHKGEIFYSSNFKKFLVNNSSS